MKRLVVLAAALLCLLVPASAFAYNPLDTACNNAGGSGGGVKGPNGSSACTTTGKDPLTGQDGVLKKVSLVLAIIAAIAAVVIIVVSGMLLVFSGGDAQKAAQARSGIIGAVIGLIVIASAESIVIFVLSKL